MAEEYIDIVDMKDNVIGKDLRSHVHSSDNWHRGIHILIFNSEGEVLLQKRSISKDKFPGCWDYSVSGHVDSGQGYDGTAARELREEMGITTDLTRLVKFRMNYGSNDNHLTVLYGGLWEGMPPKVDMKEVDEIKWHSLDGVRSLIGSGNVPKWFREEMSWWFGERTEVEVVEDYRK